MLLKFQDAKDLNRFWQTLLRKGQCALCTPCREKNLYKRIKLGCFYHLQAGFKSDRMKILTLALSALLAFSVASSRSAQDPTEIQEFQSVVAPVPVDNDTETGGIVPKNAQKNVTKKTLPIVHDCGNGKKMVNL